MLEIGLRGVFAEKLSERHRKRKIPVVLFSFAFERPPFIPAPKTEIQGVQNDKIGKQFGFVIRLKMMNAVPFRNLRLVRDQAVGKFVYLASVNAYAFRVFYDFD